MPLDGHPTAKVNLVIAITLYELLGFFILIMRRGEFAYERL